jgi:hypothetical protein
VKVRGLALALAALATALAAYLAPQDETELVNPADRNPSVQTQSGRKDAGTANSGAAILAINPRSASADDLVSAFPKASWAQPAAKAASAPEPARLPPESVTPVAPPLPFRLLGTWMEDGRVVVFLQFNDQNLVVRSGETVVDQYRVEKIDDVALTLLHLPTHQHQVLSLGGAR